MSKREKVREYVTKILKENKDDIQPFADGESLVLSGRLSSLDVVDVLTFLEGEFGYEIDPNDFDQAKFDTVDSIVGMLEQQPA
ncbi:MAG TPA: acyl carrier protein [Tepidisphaeraceae bacterium]|nr:acyl carrier protein [Tepidisphaeraceae bacterium]